MMLKWIPIMLALILAGCANTNDSSEDKTAELNMEMAYRYIQRGHFKIAQEKLEKVLEYNPSLPEAHNAIAVLYEQTGQPELAGKHYQRAVDLDSQYSRARSNYGRFLCTNNRPQEGGKQCLAAIASPEFASPEAAYKDAAICALGMPDSGRTESYLQKVLALRPDAVRMLYHTANLSYARGKYLQARGYLQRYHAKVSYRPDSLRLAINIEQALGNRQQHRVYSGLLASRFPNSNQARQLKRLE